MSDLFRMEIVLPPEPDDKGATLHTQVNGPAGGTTTFGTTALTPLGRRA